MKLTFNHLGFPNKNTKYLRNKYLQKTYDCSLTVNYYIILHFK